MKSVFRRFSFLFALVVFAAPSGAGATTLKASYSAQSITSLAIWLSHDLGFFKKHGLDVDLVLIQSSATGTAAILAGETPIAQVSGTGPIMASLGRSDMVIIATLVNNITQSLVVLPEIARPEELVGKRLGVTRFGSLSDFGLRQYLRERGLEPDKQVEILQVGGIPEILAAMKTKTIVGGPLSPPTLFVAKKSGFRELADFGSLAVRFPSTVLATTRSYIKVKRDVVLSFLRAMIEGVDHMKSNKEVSIRTLSKYMRITDPAVLDDSYKYALEKFQSRPFTSIQEVKTVLDQVKNDPRVAKAQHESFIDMTPLKEIEKEGFFTRVK